MANNAETFILTADDEPAIGLMLRTMLKGWGFTTASVTNKEQLLQQFAARKPDLVILDLEFGKDNGIVVMTELLKMVPDLTVVLLSGFGCIDTAVKAMQEGAYDFLTKPLDHLRLKTIVEHAMEKHKHALEKQQLSRQIQELKDRVGPENAAYRIWGDSPALTRLKEVIASIAPTDVTALIQGESGTGKELVARAIHDQSRRSGGPFVPVNMAALPRDLVESALFGHEKGSFTGADRIRIGHCEAADGGTLFLDEIGEMDLNIQAKLLRFLQEREIQRLGSNQTRPVNVRILAATHRDLQEMIRLGKFREDLYYRLQVVPLEVPPLRDRKGDIPLLAARFLERSAAHHDRDVVGFSPEALAILTAYEWPGNIRQLENLVERLVILSRGPEIDAAAIPAEFRPSVPSTLPRDLEPAIALSLGDVEKRTILEALRKTHGNVRAAAKILGLGQATVYRKIKEYRVPTEKLNFAEEDQTFTAAAG